MNYGIKYSMRMFVYFTLISWKMVEFIYNLVFIHH